LFSKQQKIDAVQHLVKRRGMKRRDLNSRIENKFGKQLSTLLFEPEGSLKQTSFLTAVFS
jgi:hypothetical protein